MSDYSDIIELKPPILKNHPRMSIRNRAAQFAPFAALTGYSEVIKEESRLTYDKIELSEEEKCILNDKLQIIRKNIDLNPFVTFTYFEPDTKKKGGKYNIISGNVNRIDLYKKQIIVDNDNIIPIFEIIDIKLDICDF